MILQKYSYLSSHLWYEQNAGIMATKGLSNISINGRMRQLLILMAAILVGILIALSSVKSGGPETLQAGIKEISK